MTGDDSINPGSTTKASRPTNDDRRTHQTISEHRATDPDGRLRILHVIPQFPYFGNRTIIGGHASCLLTLALAQAKSGHDVTIVSCTPNGSARIDERLALHSLFELESAGTIRFGLRFMRAAASWAKAHRDQFDAVHCHSGFADYYLVSSTLKRVTHLPTMHTLYCPIPGSGGRWHKPIIHGMIARAANRSDTLAAISRNVAASMQCFGLDPVEVTVPPVDTDRFHPPEPGEAESCRHELGIAPDEVAVLFVGNAKPQKNLIGVLHAFRRVRDRFPNARLVITTELRQSSSDENLTILRDTMSSLGLDEAVIQLGIVDDMPRLMQACDLLVAPFLDSFGPSDYFMAVLEAMACGKPAISSGVGGMPEVLGDDRGALVNPTDNDALAEAMSRFVADARLRESAGAEARAFTLRRFNPDLIASMHTRLYTS